ncbi:hypothetical protein RRG08_023687 [Elysia crispata]|uniref:Uncharacterized protein n=1 Tax=Elysia crispata TaxID=231223 RepID=A0AAE1AL63_9GAST|nr:hypothetical protein RRG08_023687 [Elysia crispata]
MKWQVVCRRSRCCLSLWYVQHPPITGSDSADESVTRLHRPRHKFAALNLLEGTHSLALTDLRRSYTSGQKRKSLHTLPPRATSAF